MEEPPVRQFAKEIAAHHNDTEVRFQAVFFADKIILSILINEAADATFDLPLPIHTAMLPAVPAEDSLPVEPIVLVGDQQNVKIQVVAAQIGKVVMHLKHPRNAILSIGTRWFARGDATNADDFEKVTFVLEHVKRLLEK